MEDVKSGTSTPSKVEGVVLVVVFGNANKFDVFRYFFPLFPSTVSVVELERE